jgi:hypothetical protein
MSIDQANAFLNEWVAENVHAVTHPQDDTEAKRLVKRCVEAAAEQGITKAELEQACGQELVKCMCDAQVAVTDADRVMENDDSHQ